MKKVFKIVFLVFTLILFVGMFLKTITSIKMVQYLEDKYNQEFVVEKKRYEFINGNFYIVVHPKNDPSISFTTEKGYGDYKYVDYYFEELWVKQLERDYRQLITKYFPDFKSFNASTAYGTGMEMVNSGDIPNYKDAPASLDLVIRFNKKAEKEINDEFYQKVLLLVQKVQRDNSEIALCFVFKSEEKEGIKPHLPYFWISSAQIRSIKSIEDLKPIFK